MEVWCQQSGLELSAALRKGDITSRELTEIHIRRILAVNGRLNAVVAERFEEARKEADAADVRLRGGGDLPVYLGVPCTVKESFAVRGMPNTGGLLSRKGQLAESDAPTVAVLRAAGAIVMGVTNTSELCMWMESYNPVYGRSSNPYDAGRIVGGSSGGEGAIVGSGASPFGLGSDIGGSIRMPAFFNGVFGHKPSSGIISNAGQFPLASGKNLDYQCTGPIARRSEDLFPLLKILEDRGEQSALRDPSLVRIADLRIHTLKSPPADADMVRAHDRALSALMDSGARSAFFEMPEFSYAFLIWSSMLAAGDNTSFGEYMFGNRGPLPALGGLLRYASGDRSHTLPLIILAAIEEFPRMNPALTSGFRKAGDSLRQRLNDSLGDDGVLLFPSYSRPAPRHNEPLLTPFDWVRTAIFNVLEVPVTQVPMGLNSGGIPVGVQVVAGHGKDHLTLAVAAELERRSGGWVPPV